MLSWSWWWNLKYPVVRGKSLFPGLLLSLYVRELSMEESSSHCWAPNVNSILKKQSNVSEISFDCFAVRFAVCTCQKNFALWTEAQPELLCCWETNAPQQTCTFHGTHGAEGSGLRSSPAPRAAPLGQSTASCTAWLGQVCQLRELLAGCALLHWVKWKYEEPKGHCKTLSIAEGP